MTHPSGLYMGMAFTDVLYITTKPLYGSVITGKEGVTDTTLQIGITAKNWLTNETAWFLPPVKQIVTIEHRPVVSGDKVMVINAEQKNRSGSFVSDCVSLNGSGIVSLSKLFEIFGK